MSGLQLSRRISIQRGQLFLRLHKNNSTTQCVRFGTTRRNWFFRKFLSPKEEEKLYLGITSAFRQKLGKQSDESAKSYSNIIEQVILTSSSPSNQSSKINSNKDNIIKTIPTLDQLQHLKQSLDNATDAATLNQLWNELDQYQFSSVALYNRLIRSYLRLGLLEKAEQVFTQLTTLMPTTRTFTYLVQAYVKAGNIDKAKFYVEKMQYLDLRLRTAFDCNVMLKYYVQADEAHAVDILWRHIVQHADTIKPGWGIYTLYMEWLLHPQNHHQSATSDVMAKVVQDALRLLEHKPTTQQAWIIAQAAETLHTTHPAVADRAMLLVARTAPKLVHKEAVDPILHTYLANGQTLKAAALYYFLRKAHVPDASIAYSETLSRLESVLRQQESYSSSEQERLHYGYSPDFSPAYYH
ncbi:hypothetical protein BDB00DRAFT_846261 [Zychaea mexicana]|uniref:uncharacterized protein n=1 Tax=Zychaea mexicana TaxID=64656 RepID=UPI0022FEE4CA|nr:uncharacterized protein BDB00DRAFT_846261 [Zychaea mexicana]KAI9488919.1 hypothetical protein BDB00DRAFT_846261 [Zychaea mexicana]